jgi:two-component system nitrogen regulation sensor histidine kinase GlnL
MRQPLSTSWRERKSSAPAVAPRSPDEPTEAMPARAPERVVDNLSTAVLLIDHELRLRFINPAAEMLLQLGASKLRGRRLAELLAPEQRLTDLLRQVLAERTVFTARGLELALLSGQAITVDCTVSPLTDTATDTDLLVELVQVDRLLRLARNDGIQRAQLANRALIAGLAHEIKNPLGGLRGAAQLLAQELGDGSLKEYTTIIIEEADRLRALVDRMIVPNPSLAQRSLNLHQVLERVCNLIEAEYPGRIRIEREYDPSLPDLIGDADQLTQAVLNVVRNAVEALNDDGCIRMRTGVERRFTIGNKRYRLVLRADIQDDGPGIPSELIDSIFYPMVTGKSEGTGLGLAIAQDIINKHGGIIQCASRPGETVFSIYLPLENEDG